VTALAAPRARSLVHEAVLAALLLGLFGLGAGLEPAFVSPATQLELSTHVFELALLALPMTLIVISAGIDLSVGSTMALAAVVLGLTHEAGAPLWLASLAAVGTGTGAGAVNGLFIARLRVHPLLVTLATLAAFRGLAEGISLGRPISGFPASFLWWGSGTAAGIPVPGLIFALAALVAWATLARTVLGSWIYTIGSNETAARRCAVPVDRVKLLLYTASGAAAGVAAVLFVARRNTAKADIGSGIELEVITAVVLGGASIFGGRGTILGTLLGLAIIHEVRELVSWHWQHDELILIVIGSILIASVLLNNVAARRRETR
jgi:rhamnose transport system permease protein